MSNNQLEILLTLRDKASAQLKKFKSATSSTIEAMKRNWLALAASITAVVLVIKKAASAFIAAGKELIKVNSKVEDLKVRMRVLTGSVEEGNKVFADMRDLASKVPQTYEEIMEASTNLTAVVKNGGEEVKKLMPIILDISAATGIGVQETTSQMIRMYSAGAASADLFRERGVLAALGFQAGVSVSNQETVDRIIQQWEDGSGKFVGATKFLSQTFGGQVSMMQDAWFNFKQQIGEKAFERARIILGSILKVLSDSKEEGGKYAEVVSSLNEKFEEMFEMAVKGFGMIVVGGGQSLDVMNEMRWIVLGIKGAWLGMIEGIFAASEGFQNFMDMVSFHRGVQFIDVEANRAAQEEVKADMQRVAMEIQEARTSADTDWSEKFKAIVGQVMQEYEKLKLKVIKDDKEIQKSKDKTSKQLIKLSKDQQKQVESLTKATESAFATALSSMIQGTSTAKEAFAALGKKMIQILADFIAEQIITMTLSKVLSIAMAAFVKSTAVAIAAAWAPAAALASLATLGANATPANAAMALSSAFSANIAALGAAAPVPAMAEGGIVTRPTLALIGEAGPEAVVPLGASGGMRNINIEVNISNPQVRSLDDIYTLSEEVSDQIAKEVERI